MGTTPPGGRHGCGSARRSLQLERVFDRAAQPLSQLLKVVGELNNGLGSSAFLIRFNDPLPFAPSTDEQPENPQRFELDYSTSNLSIPLTFTSFVVQVF